MYTKIGIIIVFNNSDNLFEIKLFELLKKLPSRATICFVGDECNSKLLPYLDSRREFTKQIIHVIEVKKSKGIHFAIKSGIRYLLNKDDFSSLGYANYSELIEILNTKNSTSSNGDKNAILVNDCIHLSKNLSKKVYPLGVLLEKEQTQNKFAS